MLHPSTRTTAFRIKDSVGKSGNSRCFYPVIAVSLLIFKMAKSLKIFRTEELLVEHRQSGSMGLTITSPRTAPFWAITQCVVVIPYRRFGNNHSVSSRTVRLFPRRPSTYKSLRKTQIAQSPFLLLFRLRTSLWRLPRPSALQNTDTLFSASPVNYSFLFVIRRSNEELSTKFHLCAVSSWNVRLPLFHLSLVLEGSNLVQCLSSSASLLILHRQHRFSHSMMLRQL